MAYSEQEIRDYVESQGYEYLGNEMRYIGNQKCKYRHIHVICDQGHEYWTPWSSFKNQNVRCQKCANEKNGVLESQIKEYVESVGYQYLESEMKEVGTKGRKQRYIHVVCDQGHEYWTMWSHFKNDESRCQKCRLSEDEIKQYVESVGYKYKSREIRTVGKDKNNITFIYVVCPEGHEFGTYWNNFKNKSYRCPKCSDNHLMSDEEIKEYVEHEGYKFLGAYLKSIGNQGRKIRYIHVICPEGHEYETQLHVFKNLGYRCNKCFHKKHGELMKGENHPNWNPNLTEEDRMDRRLIQGYKEFVQLVLKRDDYTCQCCGDRGHNNLVVHHLYAYNKYRELRTVVSNGITLCSECHNKYHSMYGKGNNTKEEFIEWLFYNKEIF